MKTLFLFLYLYENGRYVCYKKKVKKRRNKAKYLRKIKLMKDYNNCGNKS